jgi:multidrug efflux pump
MGLPGLSFPLTRADHDAQHLPQVGWSRWLNRREEWILIVEFANVQQEHGLSKLEAVREAASIRLRPILMTTVATVAGHFPLTLVSGPGAVARNSIGVVLVGGLAVGTLFTLFVVPSLYILIARDRSRDRRKRGWPARRRPVTLERGGLAIQ